jgi:hypothetical protein
MICENLRVILNGDQACFSNSSSAIEHGKRFVFNNVSGKLICKVHVVSSAVPKAAHRKFKNLQDKLYLDKKLMIKRKQYHYEERI